METDGSWPGWDSTWVRDQIEPLIEDGTAGRIIESLSRERRFAPGRPLRSDIPLKMKDETAVYVRAVAEAYHRLILQVVTLHAEDYRVREVIATPEAIVNDLNCAEETEQPAIHLMRVDSLPQPDGSIRIIETNANCPGLILFSGIVARAWRDHMPIRDGVIPPLSRLEQPDWLVNWLNELAGERALSPFCLLRQVGGNRLELDEFAQVLQRNGIETVEASPIDVTLGGGVARIADLPVEVGYLKLGMQDFLRTRPALDAFIETVRCGALFVPNGQRSRWVGDSKLCLAVLSDPRFSGCFDSTDYEAVRHAIPWSRNLALCNDYTLQQISSKRARYVIKSPLDTRGRGVVIGADAQTSAEWDAVLAAGVRQNWLVQEFVPPPELASAWSGTGPHRARHDLAIMVVNGSMVGALARSSTESRMNMALSGRFHAVFHRS